MPNKNEKKIALTGAQIENALTFAHEYFNTENTTYSIGIPGEIGFGVGAQT